MLERNGWMEERQYDESGGHQTLGGGWRVRGGRVAVISSGTWGLLGLGEGLRVEDKLR